MAIDVTSLEKGQAGNEDLKKGGDKIKVVKETVDGNPFNALTSFNPDLGSKFVSELQGSLNDINTYLNGNVVSAAEVLFAGDDTIEPTPTPTVPVGGSPYGGGPYGGTPQTSPPTVTQETHPPETQPVVTAPPTEPTSLVPTTVAPPGTGPSTVDVTQPPTEITSEPPYLGQPLQVTGLAELAYPTLNEITVALISLADTNRTPLDEFVADKNNADKIKEFLLKNPYVPDEFKEYIQDMDSEIVRVIIEDLLKGQFPEVYALDTTNTAIVRRYLSQVAEDNGITVSELISNSKYSKLLQEATQYLGSVSDLIGSFDVMSATEVQESLLGIYDGGNVEELAASDIDIMRNFVKYLSDETEIPYEDLLSDTSYANSIKEAALEFGKTADFFKATSSFSSEGIQENVSNLFNGSNYKVYGMSVSEAYNFKYEVEKAAKSNGITTEQLLNNADYAEYAREMLESSKYADGKSIISVYKDEDDTVIQEVVKNLATADLGVKIITSDGIVTLYPDSANETK